MTPLRAALRTSLIQPAKSLYTNRHSVLRRRLQSTMGADLELEHVAMNLPEDVTPEQLRSFRPFKEWISTLNRSIHLQRNTSHPFHADPYSLRSITVQSVDYFGHNRLGFVKLSAEVTNSSGEHLPGIALLRGPSVAILTMLIPEDAAPESEERYAVLTVQPRIPAGSLSFVELPAGMVDDSGTFKGAAAKEIEEELGITIHEDELLSLTDLAAEAVHTTKDDEDEDLAVAMFPSAGGCDEHITIYSYERRIPRGQLKDWSGRLTGNRSEGEKISLKIVPMKDLWKQGARDAKALAAVSLWDGVRREKKFSRLA